MNIWTAIYSAIIEYLTAIPQPALIMLVVFTLLFFIQIYLRIFVWRIPKPSLHDNPSFECNAVSVVVVIHENDESYIESGMMDILKQDYAKFELVAVDCSYDEYIGQRLEQIQKQYPNLHITTIRKGTGFDNCEKLALNIGFKTAIYDNLLTTTSKSYPTSNKWIESMASSFSEKNKQIVIGYSTIEHSKKAYDYFARCSRLLSGMGYLSAAEKGLAYRGSRHNLAYTKKLYFDSKGFNFLNMNIGENDLFVQKIANRNNTTINISRQASVKEFGFSSWHDMLSNEVLRTTTHKLYPLRFKLCKNLEVFSRAGFHGLALTLIIWLISVALGGNFPIPIYIGVASMIIIRLLAVMITAHKASIRVADKGLLGFFIIHDFISPILTFRIWIYQKLSHNYSAWR